MAQITTYKYSVDPQWVDYTMRASISALTNVVLGVAGIDAKTKGFGTDTLNKEDYSWVLLRMASEFDYRPEQYSDFSVSTWVSDFSRMMSTRNFTLQDAEGREFGRVVTQWCMINLTTRRPIDMTAPEVAKTYNNYIVDTPSPTEPPKRIGVVEPQTLHLRDVLYSDIDFNRHVNTLKYIDMMLDRLPIDLFSQNRGVRMDLNFQQECRYGQQLCICHQHNEECDLFEIKADEKTAVKGRIEWR